LNISLVHRLLLVEDLLVKCMDVKALDKQGVVERVFDTDSAKSKGDTCVRVSKARRFKEGPLHMCVWSTLDGILGTKPVIILTNDVFWSTLRVKASRPIYQLSDLFQMRSNGVFCRTCPAMNFIFEAIMKVFTLVLVGVLLVYSQYTDEMSESRIQVIEWTLILVTIGATFHEIGEMTRARSTLENYLKDVWNWFDWLSIVCLACWVCFTYRGGRYNPYHAGQSAHNLNPPTPDAKVFLAVSAVPLSLSLLQFMSLDTNFGTLVYVLFALCRVLLRIIVVFLVCMFGFALAFHGLFRTAPNHDGVYKFDTFLNTLIVLFDATLGQHDFTMFDDDPYYNTGIILFFLYIIITVVGLMSVVIAAFTNTYERYRNSSLHVWSIFKMFLNGS